MSVLFNGYLIYVKNNNHNIDLPTLSDTVDSARESTDDILQNIRDRLGRIKSGFGQSDESDTSGTASGRFYHSRFTDNYIK